MTYIRDALAAINDEMRNLQPGQAELYALLLLLKGEHTTDADVHDVWGLWRIATDPDNPLLVPWHQLPHDTVIRGRDRDCRDAVHRATRRFRRQQQHHADREAPR